MRRGRSGGGDDRADVDNLADQILWAAKKALMDKFSPITDRYKDTLLGFQVGAVKTSNKILGLELKSTYTAELSERIKAKEQRKIEKLMRQNIGEQLDANRELYARREKYYDDLAKQYGGDTQASKMIREARDSELGKLDSAYAGAVKPYQQMLEKQLSQNTFIQRDEKEAHDHLGADLSKFSSSIKSDYQELARILEQSSKKGLTEALQDTPIQIEKSLQEKEDEFREQTEAERNRIAELELTDNFQDESLDLQGEQLKYLKRIADKDFKVEGGSGGGGGVLGTLTDALGFGNPLGGDQPGGKKRGLARMMSGFASKGAGLLKGAGAIVSKAAIPLAIATAGYGAVKGGMDTDAIARRTGKDAEDITIGDRIKQGAGGALSMLTGGLVSTDTVLNTGEKFKNFFTGNGFKTNNELKREGVDTEEGVGAILSSANPLSIMTDLVTGNAEGNAAIRWFKDKVGLTTDEDRAKREEAKQKRMSQVGYDSDEDQTYQEAQSDAEQAMALARGEFEIDDEDGLDELQREQNLERSALVAQADREGLYATKNHLQELDEAYGVTQPYSPDSEMELADADTSPVGGGNTTIVTNNNSTIVQQEAPRFRISDQSTMMLAVQGA